MKIIVLDESKINVLLESSHDDMIDSIIQYIKGFASAKGKWFSYDMKNETEIKTNDNAEV
jgi:hypothetical protein